MCSGTRVLLPAAKMRNESRSKSQRAEDDTWSKWPETTTVKILEGNIKERLTISIESVMGARSYLRRPAKPARRHYHPVFAPIFILGALGGTIIGLIVGKWGVQAVVVT